MTIWNRIEIIRGDITLITADAIVNAANNSLLGGGGVDGAIHRAAGPALLSACRTLGGCATGEAKITRGYRLPAKWVIHTVGPVWRGGHKKEAYLLASAYRESLLLAREYELKSIAFPNISTGVYGFPKEMAAEIAIEEVSSYLKLNSLPEKVIFCIFDQENFDIYQEIFQRSE